MKFQISFDVHGYANVEAANEESANALVRMALRNLSLSDVPEFDIDDIHTYAL